MAFIIGAFNAPVKAFFYPIFNHWPPHINAVCRPYFADVPAGLFARLGKQVCDGLLVQAGSGHDVHQSEVTRLDCARHRQHAAQVTFRLHRWHFSNRGFLLQQKYSYLFKPQIA
ncbi:MAG: hypothetical protein V4713_03780 [Pseudomonadota bacterium]